MMYCFRFSPIPDATKTPPSSVDYQFKCSKKGDPFSFTVTRYIKLCNVLYVCIHTHVLFIYICNGSLRICDVHSTLNDP